MALFHSFKLVILRGTAYSPRRSNSAIVYNRESSALCLLLRGENVTIVSRTTQNALSNTLTGPKTDRAGTSS